MNQLILEELRQLILNKFDLHQICPSDCQYIALEISRKTKKNISATTIKRIFGLAAANHQFSKFTVNILLDFLENEQSLSLNYLLENGRPMADGEMLDSISLKARVISKLTYKILTEKCTITFDSSIDRRFATHDFEAFYHSSDLFTAFIAQPGYGKSILMSHLVQQNFLAKHAKYHLDILLYLPADKLFYTDRAFIDLEQRIFELLGINTQQNLAEYFNDIFEKSGKKLIIIVDSLYDVCREKGAKQKIFQGIVQFLTNIAQTDSIKFIFGARTYIWRRFYENIKDSVFLQSKWFKGSYYNALGQTNIPVFSRSEVRQLLAKINVDESTLHPHVLAELKYPLNYANFYYFKDQSDLTSKLIYYRLFQNFITEKLSGSTNQPAMLSVCKLIIELSNFGKNGDRINKSLLIEDLHQFKDAYMQLLHEGILTEEKHELNGFDIEYVKFTQPGMFDYFLYKTISEKKVAQFNKLTDYVHLPHLTEVINWAIFNAINQNQYRHINEILHLSLSPSEFTEILVLIGEQLSCKLNNQPKSIDLLKLYSIETAFIDKLTQFDFLDPKFVPILDTLIQISYDDRTKIHCHNLLTLHDCLTLNLIKLEQRLEVFKNKSYQLSQGCIDPIELINHAMAKLTCTKYNRQFLVEQYHSLISVEAKDVKSAKLIEITLAILEWLFDDGNILINEIARDRYLKPIKRSSHSIHFQYLMHLLRTDNLSKSNTKVRQLEHILHHQMVRYPNPTFFGRALSYLIKVQKHIYTGYYMLAIAELEQAIGFYQAHDYKFLEIKSYKLAIVIYTHLEENDKVIEYKYLIMSLLESESLKKYRFKLSLINA